MLLLFCLIDLHPLMYLGLILGKSPFCACNVYLVQNLTTCLISPRSITADLVFKTVKLNGTDITTIVNWRQQAGFCHTDGTHFVLDPQGIIGDVVNLPME